MNQQFKKIFPGNATSRMASAPGRVNIIGEHTDYNEGFVMPVALPMRIEIAWASNSDKRLRIHSLAFKETVEMPLSELRPLAKGHWANYPLGICLQLQKAGVKLAGFNAVIGGNLPFGAGVSSSAALLVAFGKAALSAADAELPALALAQLCRRAEHEFAGANVGIMDMLTAALDLPGRLVFLDCRHLFWRVADPPSGLRFVVLNTGVKHNLAANAYNTRVEECRQAVAALRKLHPGATALRDGNLKILPELEKNLPPIIFKRARHVISENERARAAVMCLDRGYQKGFAKAMNLSHDSLRDDYEVSCQELDDLVSAARNHPACLASRMTGGGFGGCTVSLVKESGLADFIRSLGANRLVSAL